MQKGTTHTEEVIEGFRASRSGSKNAMWGRKQSDKQKAAVSAALKGTKWNDERRAAHVPHPHTPESKAKISAAVKAWWAAKKAEQP